MNSLAIGGRCRQIHLPHATFSQVQSLHRSHSTHDMCAWLKVLAGLKELAGLKFELRPQNSFAGPFPNTDRAQDLSELGVICKNDSTLGHHHYSTFVGRDLRMAERNPSQTT